MSVNAHRNAPLAYTEALADEKGATSWPHAPHGHLMAKPQHFPFDRGVDGEHGGSDPARSRAGSDPQEGLRT